MRVLVLAGGPSSERVVSLESGRAVAEACRRLRHEVIEADFLPKDHSALDYPCNVIFPVLHGPYGEDGTLQAMLDERSLRYVGSGAAASRLAMDKHASKKCWREAGLATAAWTTIARGDTLPANPIAPPAVVKPVGEGSSVGVVFCASREEVNQAVWKALEQFDRLMVERRLFGRELTVGILGDRALPIVEVRPATAYYDYEAKYLRADTRYVVEPDLGEATCRAVQELALAAYGVLGCRHYGRVDLILDEHEGPQLLEINTIPGFTEHSLLPKAAAHVGIAFDHLVQTLLELAMDENTLKAAPGWHR